MSMSNKGREVVLVMSDLQAPFEHQDTVHFLKWAKDKFKPTKVVNIGDEADFHSISNYDPNPDGLSPGDELAKAIEHLKPIYKLFPDVMVCTSNHTARPFRKAYKFGLPAVFLKDYREFLKAPKGWKWADYWDVDGVRYEHGEGFSGPLGARKAALGNMMPTVIGHLHSHAGILFSANSKHLIWGMNVGSMIDIKSYAFAYGKHLVDKPIISIGIVTKQVPQVVPMTLDKFGRWTGPSK